MGDQEKSAAAGRAEEEHSDAEEQPLAEQRLRDEPDDAVELDSEQTGNLVQSDEASRRFPVRETWLPVLDEVVEHPTKDEIGEANDMGADEDGASAAALGATSLSEDEDSAVPVQDGGVLDDEDFGVHRVSDEDFAVLPADEGSALTRTIDPDDAVMETLGGEGNDKDVLPSMDAGPAREDVVSGIDDVDSLAGVDEVVLADNVADRPDGLPVGDGQQLPVSELDDGDAELVDGDLPAIAEESAPGEVEVPDLPAIAEESAPGEVEVPDLPAIAEESASLVEESAESAPVEVPSFRADERSGVLQPGEILLASLQQSLLPEASPTPLPDPSVGAEAVEQESKPLLRSAEDSTGEGNSARGTPVFHLSVEESNSPWSPVASNVVGEKESTLEETESPPSPVLVTERNVSPVSHFPPHSPLRNRLSSTESDEPPTLDEDPFPKTFAHGEAPQWDVAVPSNPQEIGRSPQLRQRLSSAESVHSPQLRQRLSSAESVPTLDSDPLQRVFARGEAPLPPWDVVGATPPVGAGATVGLQNSHLLEQAVARLGQERTTTTPGSSASSSVNTGAVVVRRVLQPEVVVAQHHQPAGGSTRTVPQPSAVPSSPNQSTGGHRVIRLYSGAESSPRTPDASNVQPLVAPPPSRANTNARIGHADIASPVVGVRGTGTGTPVRAQQPSSGTGMPVHSARRAVVRAQQLPSSGTGTPVGASTPTGTPRVVRAQQPSSGTGTPVQRVVVPRAQQPSSGTGTPVQPASTPTGTPRVLVRAQQPSSGTGTPVQRVVNLRAQQPSSGTGTPAQPSSGVGSPMTPAREIPRHSAASAPDHTGQSHALPDHTQKPWASIHSSLSDDSMTMEGRGMDHSSPFHSHGVVRQTSAPQKIDQSGYGISTRQTSGGVVSGVVRQASAPSSVPGSPAYRIPVAPSGAVRPPSLPGSQPGSARVSAGSAAATGGTASVPTPKPPQLPPQSQSGAGSYTPPPVYGAAQASGAAAVGQQLRQLIPRTTAPAAAPPPSSRPPASIRTTGSAPLPYPGTGPLATTPQFQRNVAVPVGGGPGGAAGGAVGRGGDRADQHTPQKFFT